jgi:uncharacterized membrane protein
MSELIVVDYHDTLRARRVLSALQQRHPEWCADLADALVFVLRANGKALNTAGWQEQMRLSDDFLCRVRRLIRPGDSALVLLIRTADADQVLDAVQRYGGRVLHTSVTPCQAGPFRVASGLASAAQASV